MQGDHPSNVSAQVALVEIPVRSMPLLSTVSGGARYRSTLGPLLAMSERRLADRSHPIDVMAIADEVVRRQRVAMGLP